MRKSCNFCHEKESENNPLLPGDETDLYICSHCILKGYTILFGNRSPIAVFMANDKNDYFTDTRYHLDEMFEDIKKVMTLNQARQHHAVCTFQTLEEHIQGFHRGELVLIYGDEKIGKSTLAINLSVNALKRNESLAYISTELSSTELLERILSSHTSIAYRNLRYGELETDQWNYLFDAGEHLSQKDIWIEEDGFEILASVEEKITLLNKAHPEIDLIFIDHLQEGYLRWLDNTISSDIMAKLKHMAKTLGVTIIVLYRLGTSQSVFSTKMVPYADTCIRLEQNCLDNNTYKATIEKSHHGATGAIDLFFQKGFLRFCDVVNSTSTKKKEK